jgi:hypothetical protein
MPLALTFRSARPVTLIGGATASPSADAGTSRAGVEYLPSGPSQLSDLLEPILDRRRHDVDGVAPFERPRAPPMALPGRCSWAAELHRGQIMLTRSGSVISASRGTLAGDILWLATIGFVFAVIAGIVG